MGDGAMCHYCRRYKCICEHPEEPQRADEVDALRAQAAMLREALDRVLHNFVRSDMTMDGEYWALRCLPPPKIAEVAKSAKAALAATEADAATWLERQRKLAAAEELDRLAEGWGRWVPDPNVALRYRAAQLQKEAGCE